jgi:SM-20-related protein
VSKYVNAYLESHLIDPTAFDQIADNLVEKGYMVLPYFLPTEVSEGLFIDACQMDASYFKRARIGREKQQQINDFVRTDQIHWIQGKSDLQKAFLNYMEQLRVELNRRLFMGLFDYECHFAHYGQGDYYKRHLDAFKGRSNRVLSTVLYLNPGWTQDDGGELVMYKKKQQDALLKVTPLFGTFVIFLSERFPHEVLPANRDRYSVAGWFRVNNSLGGQIDPAS